LVWRISNPSEVMSLYRSLMASETRNPVHDSSANKVL
jgi:hypothetical protein